MISLLRNNNTRKLLVVVERPVSVIERLDISNIKIILIPILEVKRTSRERYLVSLYEVRRVVYLHNLNNLIRAIRKMICSSIKRVAACSPRNLSNCRNSFSYRLPISMAKTKKHIDYLFRNSESFGFSIFHCFSRLNQNVSLN